MQVDKHAAGAVVNGAILHHDFLFVANLDACCDVSNIWQDNAAGVEKSADLELDLFLIVNNGNAPKTDVGNNDLDIFLSGSSNEHLMGVDTGVARR